MAVRNAIRRCAVILGVGVLALSACGSDSSATQAKTVVLEFVNTAIEDLNFVRSIEADGRSIQYGTLGFEGSGTFGDQNVDTELLAYLNYVDGVGPAGGYLTITTEDGDSLVFLLSLTASKQNEGVELNGPFTVIAGTGRFAVVTGSGTGVGVRDATLGSGVRWSVSLDLEGLEN